MSPQSSMISILYQFKLKYDFIFMLLHVGKDERGVEDRTNNLGRKLKLGNIGWDLKLHVCG